MTKVMTSINQLNDTLGKKCLVALSYFDAHNNALKQSLLAGEVIAVDAEIGITLQLFSVNDNNRSVSASSPHKKPHNKPAQLIIPADLSCWFTAPKGDFHTSQAEVKITDPDYLVTWDVYQQKNKPVNEGEQQWWQWRPRTIQPIVG